MAGVLLDSHLCCLKHPHHDFALKVRIIFYEDFVFMSSTGRCTVMLFSFMCSVLSNCFDNTQIVEGMNSSLQTFASRAPNIKIPLVASRMSLMYGQKLTPSSCTELHDEIVSYMGTDASFQRFIHDDSVCGQVVCSSGHPEALCEHVATDIMKYASVFVKYATNCMSISVRTCYCVHFRSRMATMHGAPGILVAWSYHKSLWVVHGTFWKVGSVLRFNITLPLRCCSLLCSIKDCLQNDDCGPLDNKNTMTVLKYKVVWETLSQATIHGKAVAQTSVKHRAGKGKGKRKGGGKGKQANDPAPLCDDMDQHEHGGDEVVVDDSEVGGLIDLEYELERLIEQDLVEGDALAESLCVDDLNDVEQDVPEREHSEQEDEDEQASVVIDPARVEVLEEAFSMCKVQAEAIASAYTKARVFL